jgi:hypothetical protein
MKKLALGTLLIAGLLAACGGGDDDIAPVADAPIDASTDGDGPGPGLCNPLGEPGQQGCNPGQKCTWIRVQETPERLGKIGCVPDGTVQLGGACAYGPAGETTGFDDCAAGLACPSGSCTDICGFDGSAAGMCASGFNCTRYDSMWANGEDDPLYGSCNAGCNPITQQQAGAGMPPCPSGEGCYMLTSQTETIAVCAGAGNVTHNSDIVGPAFANSCVPGAQPRRKEPTSMTVQCGGLCNPVDVTSTTNMAAEGGAEIAGNATAKDNCQTSWGANPPQDGTAGESCRFWWAREPFEGLSPYSNTVGWCFKHAVFQYDTNGDNMDDAPFPRCIALTTGDVVPPIGNPMHNDAQYFWCVALPATATLGDAINSVKKWSAMREPKLDRLAPVF